MPRAKDYIYIASWTLRTSNRMEKQKFSIKSSINSDITQIKAKRNFRFYSYTNIIESQINSNLKVETNKIETDKVDA